MCVCTGDQTQEPSVPDAGNCSLFSREWGAGMRKPWGRSVVPIVLFMVPVSAAFPALPHGLEVLPWG